MAKAAKKINTGVSPAASDPTGQGLFTFRAIDTLTPYSKNARTHSENQIAELVSAIKTYGYTNPILVDAVGIVAGHGRREAVKRIYAAGDTMAFPNGEPIPAGTVPTVDCTGWSDGKRRAYIIWDNKSSLQAGWDFSVLAEELESLREVGMFDLTGFEAEELKAINLDLNGLSEEDENYSRKIEAPVYKITGEKPAVSDLLDTTKTKELRAEIEAAALPEDVKAFLLAAADRHTVFNFRNIAEFYAHSDAPVQDLMEKSALVVIDYKQAIEYGFVKLTEEMLEQADKQGPESP